MNAVMQRLLQQRAEQITFIDQLLARVDTEERDLVDAERANLEAARQRIGELDLQLGPLEEFDRIRGEHQESLAQLPANMGAGRPPARRVAGSERAPEYTSAGAFLVDHLRARGMMRPGDTPDPAAQARMQQVRAIQDQTTGQTAGLLPVPIVGAVVNLIDASRPMISSLGGAKALGGIPGSSFTRPRITQHVTVGVQTAEKTELPSQRMVVGSVGFSKKTYGGTVDISRQDIDWTSPAAWDILIKDLADVYAIQTETAVATDFEGTVAGTAVPVATNDLAGWAAALYPAAAESYRASFLLPDRIWCSLDVWATLGALVDVARVVFPQTPGQVTAGTSSLSDFRGDVLGLPRVVVPTLPAATCIVGPSTLYEAYEEVIGLLSVVEPSILGVQVAYGGYVAFGNLEGSAFIPLTAPAGLGAQAGGDSGSSSGSGSSSRRSSSST